jgi:predicted PurR-regulated permease PerM
MPDSTLSPPPTTETGLAVPETRYDLRTIFLGVLVALAVLAVCYVAAEIILPIVLAGVLCLVFQPVLRALEALYLPRVLAAVVIIVALVALCFMLGYLLSGAVAAWIADLPQTLAKLEARLNVLAAPLHSLQRALERVESMAPDGIMPALAVESSPLPTRILAAIRQFAAGAFTMLLVLFFMLVAGDRFLRHLVEILPRYQAKRQAVEIAQQIEHDISAYLATVTMMNLLVGIATGVAMMLCGLGNPLLWGTVAFLLNYVPVLGPTAGVILFLVTGLVTIDTLWGALVPPVIYWLIHLAEGETVTPMLLAGRFTINPVLIIVSLVFWYWMWGVAGAVLSTPMLAIAKIVCGRIEALQPVGHFIEG